MGHDPCREKKWYPSSSRIDSLRWPYSGQKAWNPQPERSLKSCLVMIMEIYLTEILILLFSLVLSFDTFNILVRKCQDQYIKKKNLNTVCLDKNPEVNGLHT